MAGRTLNNLVMRMVDPETDRMECMVCGHQQPAQRIFRGKKIAEESFQCPNHCQRSDKRKGKPELTWANIHAMTSDQLTDLAIECKLVRWLPMPVINGPLPGLADAICRLLGLVKV